MELIKDKKFGGERPLFGVRDARIENVEITDGESAIKVCSDLEVRNCRFFGKYPLWHVDRSLVTDCYFAPESRSAIWYSNDMVMRDCHIDAPKLFREMNNVTVENVKFTDADETFWNIRGLKVKNVEMREGTYPFMYCSNVEVDGLNCESKYVFQYVKNAVIRNAKITTKDAFWETDNVTIYDSEIDGEYLGWHSRNLKLVNCHIGGEQPLCYAQNLVLENCTFDPACDLAFEDSTVNATINGNILSIKNPTSGHIVADSIGHIVIDDNILPPANCIIETRK